MNEPAFRPPWWLRNAHVQTLWPALLRRRPAPRWRPEVLELPDGDCLQLLWGPERARPRVLLLHGLGGNSASPYIAGLASQLVHQGYCPVVMHYRGVGMLNRLDRFYHAGAIDDLEAVARWLLSTHPRLSMVGYSLGGSILLNWLAAHAEQAPVDAAVAVSVPYQLSACADALEQGFSRIYQADLLRSLKRLVARKFAGRRNSPVDLGQVKRLRSLRAFDEHLTAPLHGFQGAEDYYTRCSSGAKLHRIRRPTLLLQAADDPFVPAHALPNPAELPAEIHYELSAHGGHVGFVGAAVQGRPRYWLEQRIVRYLSKASAAPVQASSGPALHSRA